MADKTGDADKSFFLNKKNSYPRHPHHSRNLRHAFDFSSSARSLDEENQQDYLHGEQKQLLEKTVRALGKRHAECWFGRLNGKFL